MSRKADDEPKHGKVRRERTLNAPRALASGFISAILIGAILLSLPVSGKGKPVSALDALFTSTSAVCVTGLVTVDTGTRFSTFGQVVILILIQVGGLGIMTFSTLLVAYTGGTVSMRFHMLLKEALNRLTYRNLFFIAKLIFLLTAVIEGAGALLLLAGFARSFPLSEAAWLAVFHSISAFCNAGFSLFSDSLVRYHSDAFMNITFCVLIVAGGIGFPVLIELIEYRRARKLSVHARLALVMTAALIFLGAAGLLAFEYLHNLDLHRDSSLADLALESVFQSVTARTAGFNTVVIGRLSAAALFLMMILMFIGASPGGTGGGVKTTTFGVLLAAAWAVVRGKRDVNVFRRRLSDELLMRAFTVAVIYLMLVASVTVLMLCVKSFGIAATLFEVLSAAGTVGLSTGITPQLAPAEKCFIILAMFCGRIGPVSIVMALIEREKKQSFRFPEGKIMIG
ncbi:MAG: potassium transporter TrkG [bacterium]